MVILLNGSKVESFSDLENRGKYKKKTEQFEVI